MAGSIMKQNAPKVSAYPATTHSSSETCRWSDFSIDGSATFTIVLSSMIMNRPNETFATIEYPGASTIDSTTKALDINASGLITGQYQQTTLSNGDTIWHGFMVTGVQ